MKDALGQEIQVYDRIASIYHSWLVPAMVTELIPAKRKNGEDKVRVVEDVAFGYETIQKCRVVPLNRIVKINQPEQPPRTEDGEIDWGELERRGDYRWHEQDTDRIRDGLSDGNYSVDKAQARDMGW